MRTLGMMLIMYGLGWVSGMPQDKAHYMLALFPLGIGLFLMTLDTVFDVMSIIHKDTIKRKRKGHDNC